MFFKNAKFREKRGQFSSVLGKLRVLRAFTRKLSVTRKTRSLDTKMYGLRVKRLRFIQKCMVYA